MDSAVAPRGAHDGVNDKLTIRIFIQQQVFMSLVDGQLLECSFIVGFFTNPSSRTFTRFMRFSVSGNSDQAARTSWINFSNTGRHLVLVINASLLSLLEKHLSYIALKNRMPVSPMSPIV